MKIQFFKTTALEKPIRLAVHRSGKLGFPKEAETKLDLKETEAIGIGKNAEDEHDENLYLVTYKENEEGAFKVSKAGEYYYLNTKYLFDNLGIDYRTGLVSFDMTKMDIDGQTVYKLAKLKRERKDNDKSKTKTQNDNVMNETTT
jgi:hypothetical protein